MLYRIAGISEVKRDFFLYAGCLVTNFRIHMTNLLGALALKPGSSDISVLSWYDDIIDPRVQNLS